MLKINKIKNKYSIIQVKCCGYELPTRKTRYYTLIAHINEYCAKKILNEIYKKFPQLKDK